MLSSVDGDALDRALRDWAASHCDPEGALALDGKRVRGASRQMDGDENCHLVAALEHGSGLVRGQVQVADKTNEIPAVRDLLAAMDLAGRIVTADAMHTQTETARLILGKGADDLLTAKDNQTEMLDDIRAIDWARAAAGECETVDRAHGRIDTRRCRVVELDETFDGYALLPGRRQAFRIERERRLADKTTTETAHGLTSLPPERAGAAEILDLARRHWEIENRLHHVRDVSYDEDRRRNHLRACRAISPVCATPPSPSCVCAANSTICPKPIATTPPANRTPSAKSPAPTSDRQRPPSPPGDASGLSLTPGAARLIRLRRQPMPQNRCIAATSESPCWGLPGHRHSPRNRPEFIHEGRTGTDRGLRHLLALCGRAPSGLFPTSDRSLRALDR